jgi:predicted transcriptional regulator
VRVKAVPSSLVDRLMMISIHPSHAEAIVSGEKTTEFRRSRPVVEIGQPILIYATSPTAAVIARCVVHGIDQGALADIWSRHRAQGGITRPEFDAYYQGRSTAFAIRLADVVALPAVVKLGDLRRAGNFHPPQTWHFLDRARALNLFSGHPSGPEIVGLFG